MTFKVILEPSEDGGFTATVPALPGCVSEGDTVEQAMANIREAAELYLEPVEVSWPTAPGTPPFEFGATFRGSSRMERA